MSTLANVMSSDPVSISSAAPLREAAQLMKAHDIGMLPVVDNGRLIGVVTDRDIVVRGLATGDGVTISDVLTRDVVVAAPGDDPADIVKKMSSADVRRVPVCDGERLVGVVSVGDLAVKAEPALAGAVMESTGPTK